MSNAAVTIPLSEPCIRGNASAYLDECLRTNFVSSVGPFVERFEREFADYVGSKHAVACASGTAALHVAMRLLGISAGDEVLVPTLTFIASANPVVYERGTPVLVDAEEQTWNMDPALVVDELESRARTGRKMPAAVEVVHILGHPADIDPIVDVCARFGVPIIEDAAEALGARYADGSAAGKQVGTIGKIGCFSFNGNKIITTGGGGMITTDDPALAKRAKHLTTQARLPGAAYRHDEIGFNYRLTNVAAALGVAQLELLPEFLVTKQRWARNYDQALAGIPGIALAARTPWATPTFWLYTVRVDAARYGLDRDATLAKLGRAGAQARPIWSPLHTMPMYAHAPRLGGAVAERIFSEALSLPSSVSMTEQDQERVVAALTTRGT